jgi:hypothetical protein
LRFRLAICDIAGERAGFKLLPRCPAEHVGQAQPLGSGHALAGEWARSRGGVGTLHAGGPPPTAHCPLPTADCPLPTARCRLPTAYCLLPTADCPLPTAD